jgi:hypothetical protein
MIDLVSPPSDRLKAINGPFVETKPKQARGNAHDNCVRRNVFGDDRARPDYRAVADRNAGHHDRLNANPNVMTDANVMVLVRFATDFGMCAQSIGSMRPRADHNAIGN